MKIQLHATNQAPVSNPGQARGCFTRLWPALKRIAQRSTSQPALAACLWLLSGSASVRSAEVGVPAPASRGPATLHVSKLGDNSDGSSWAKAFHSIQAALQAIPDARGGHRIIVRPDTYAEANLYGQPVPAGFERLRFWPVETFNELLPARFARPDPAFARTNMPAR